MDRRRLGALTIALAVGLVARATPALDRATPEEAWDAILDGPPGYFVPLGQGRSAVLRLVCTRCDPICFWLPSAEGEHWPMLGHANEFSVGVIRDDALELRGDLAARPPRRWNYRPTLDPLQLAWSAGVLPPTSARGLAAQLRAARIAGRRPSNHNADFHDPTPAILTELEQVVRERLEARLEGHSRAALFEGLVAGLVVLLVAWPWPSSRWRRGARVTAASLVLVLPWSLGFHQGELEAPVSSGLPASPYVALLRGPVRWILGSTEPRGPTPLRGLAPGPHDGTSRDWRGPHGPPRLLYLLAGPLLGCAALAAGGWWWRTLTGARPASLGREAARALLTACPAVVAAALLLHTDAGEALLLLPGDLPGDLLGSRRLAVLGSVTVGATLGVLAFRLSRRRPE